MFFLLDQKEPKKSREQEIEPIKAAIAMKTYN